MKTQHTPGPWEASRDAVPAGWVQITVYAESDGQRVATVYHEEAARLIAAAPELLAACREALTRNGVDCGKEINVGTLLGSVSTPAKARSSRENGKLGGRPKKPKRIARRRNAPGERPADSAHSTTPQTL